MESIDAVVKSVSAACSWIWLIGANIRGWQLMLKSLFKKDAYAEDFEKAAMWLAIACAIGDILTK